MWTTTTLDRLTRRADIVLLPYDSREQVTSGVLVEAVAAGKPVVATAFPHAVELLSSGAGLVVEQRDGAALGEALYRVLTEPGQAQRMRAEATRIAPSLRWPAVAD
jgi:polysaccharide biosynthesis protein PslF